MKRFLNYPELDILAGRLASYLFQRAATLDHPLRVYPVPRGGVPAAFLVHRHFQQTGMKMELVSTPETADVVLDDLVDSGATMERYLKQYFHLEFVALIHKGTTPGFNKGEWLVFPWEHSAEHSIEDNFTRLLQYCGEDPARGGLKETPARMAKAWAFWTSGYKADPAAVLKTFEDGGENYDEMIHSGAIPFYSQCEHHLAPFFGTVQFAYIPDKRIVGLSKMSRLVNVFARRLQVQERLTVQIVDAFVSHMAPKGAACVVKARHLCMESRGICQQGIVTTTSALRGVIKEQPAARAEFFSLSNGH